MADAQFVLSAISGSFDAFANKIQEPIAKAATAAVKEAAGIVKSESRAAFAAAGFGGRSGNAMRATVTPKEGNSMTPAADFFLRPAYLNVFEQGATITGKPFLWLPLDTVPFGDGGKRLTPKQYIERIGPLHSARGAKRPLLVGKGSREGILRATSKVVRVRKKALAAGRIQGTTNVPLFVGVPSVTISKRVDLAGIVQRVSNRIGELYLKHFKAF